MVTRTKSIFNISSRKHEDEEEEDVSCDLITGHLYLACISRYNSSSLSLSLSPCTQESLLPKLLGRRIKNSLIAQWESKIQRELATGVNN